MKNSSQTLFPTSYFILTGLCIFLLGIGCKSSTTKDGTGDLAGFEFSKIPGTTIKSAKRKDPRGQVVVEGFADGDKKVGQWIEYNEEGDISTITNYINGLLEGPALKMAYRGQVDQRTTYHAGQLDGPWVQYKFGKILETRVYRDGKLNGTVKTYDEKTYKVRQETEYKNGVQDGYYRYYDDNGNVSMEYQYKNGEKVSGGMVKKE
jgi:antitoxin component YwqK of YwqJK toxin-antitoxin module